MNYPTHWLKPYRLKLSQGCLMASSLNNLCGVVGYYFFEQHNMNLSLKTYAIRRFDNICWIVIHVINQTNKK